MKTCWALPVQRQAVDYDTYSVSEYHCYEVILAYVSEIQVNRTVEVVQKTYQKPCSKRAIPMCEISMSTSLLSFSLTGGHLEIIRMLFIANESIGWSRFTEQHNKHYVHRITSNIYTNFNMYFLNERMRRTLSRMKYNNDRKQGRLVCEGRKRENACER